MNLRICTIAPLNSELSTDANDNAANRYKDSYELISLLSFRNSMRKSFTHSSFFLFIDYLILSLSGWLFWIIIGKFSTVSNLGQASYLFTLAAFFSGILLLGLEFPLLRVVNLRKSIFVQMSQERLRTLSFSTILIFEITVNVLFIPVVLILLTNTHRNLDYLVIISTVLILVFTSIGTTARYALLGILSTKSILVADIFSTAIRGLTALYLLYMGQGVLAILLATVLQTLILAALLTYLFISKMGFEMGNRNLLLSLLKEGLANFPGKISRMIVAPLSVILVGVIGVNVSEAGIFFISLIITLAAASFANSMATISVPAMRTNINAVNISFRLGVSLTTPIIVILISFPKLILKLISSNYEAGYVMLVILSVAILPSIIVFNIITRLNLKNENKKLTLIGTLELGLLVLLLLGLVPNYPIIGPPTAILISYSISAIVACRWLRKSELIQIVKAIISIISGIVLGFIFRILVGDVVALVMSFFVTLIVNHLLRALTFGEIWHMILSLIKQDRG